MNENQKNKFDLDTGLDFVSTASHELKSSLNTILSASQILLNFHENRIDRESMSYVQFIFKESQKLIALIENLLNISEIESNDFILKTKSENVSKIIKGCVNTVKYIYKDRNLSFIINLPEFLYLDVEKIKFEILINNLLINAAKFTHPFGKIKIESKFNDSFVNIAIIDDGIGLTDNEKKLLFKKFSKIDRSNNLSNSITNGHGFGLYISKKIIELHGGEIRVVSEGRNRGSSFILRFPLNS